MQSTSSLPLGCLVTDASLPQCQTQLHETGINPDSTILGVEPYVTQTFAGPEAGT